VWANAIKIQDEHKKIRKHYKVDGIELGLYSLK